MFVNSITAVILNKEQLLSTKREAVRRLSRTGMMTKRVDSSIVVVDVYRLEETWVINDNMNRQMATHPFYWELCPLPYILNTVCRLIFYKECSWVKVNIFHAKGHSCTLLAYQPSNLQPRSPTPSTSSLGGNSLREFVIFGLRSLFIFFACKKNRLDQPVLSHPPPLIYGAIWIILFVLC